MVAQEQEKHKPMIHVHDLWKSYGPFKVLQGLSLDVFEGETLVILGRSGVGKSVLLKQIIGLEKPDKGFVEINGTSIIDIPIQKRFKDVKKMGMLFQNAALFDSMTIEENTVFYLRQHEKIPEKELQERARKALQMVGLEGSEKKMPSEISGGMKKRAALARVIIYEPAIILYDEPTAGLDPITSVHINELINKTKEELKATSIVVTHDLRSALEVGDRLALHHEGKIEKIASKEQFFHIEDPLIQSFFEKASLKGVYD